MVECVEPRTTCGSKAAIPHPLTQRKVNAKPISRTAPCGLPLYALESARSGVDTSASARKVHTSVEPRPRPRGKAHTAKPNTWCASIATSCAPIYKSCIKSITNQHADHAMARTWCGVLGAPMPVPSANVRPIVTQSKCIK